MILFQRIFRTSFLVFFLGLMRPAHNIFKGIVFFCSSKGFVFSNFFDRAINNVLCTIVIHLRRIIGYNKQQFWHEHSNNRRIKYDQEQRVSEVNHIKLLQCESTQRETEIQSFLLISACFSIDILFCLNGSSIWFGFFLTLEFFVLVSLKMRRSHYSIPFHPDVVVGALLMLSRK